VFTNKIVRSADVPTIGQKIFLVADQDTISRCLYYDLYGDGPVNQCDQIGLFLSHESIWVLAWIW